MTIEIEFNAANRDIHKSRIFWYESGCEDLFIEQLEAADGTGRELLLIGRDGVQELIDALQKYLSQTEPLDAYTA